MLFAGLNIAARYRAAVIADSPVAYWRLGESSGTVATDETGNYPGTFVGSPTLGVAGIYAGGAAVDFDGTNDRVSIGSLALTGFTRSIGLWIKTTATSPQWIWGRLNTGASELTMIGINYTESEATASGSLLIGQRTSAGTLSDTHRCAVNLGINDGDWHYLGAVFQGGQVAKIYIDGVQTTVMVNATESPVVATTGAFNVVTSQIGCRDNRGTMQGFFDGAIADFCLYSTALSADRWAAHYAAAGY